MQQRVQQEMMKELEHLSYEKRLRLGSVWPGGEEAQGNTRREQKGWREALFSSQCQDQRHKQKHRSVPCEHQETFLHCGLTEHWHRLPREVVDSPALEKSRSHLDTVLGKWF